MTRIVPLLLLLSGCAGATTPQIASAAGAVTIASIVAIQRTPLDAIYSLITGKDCSVVRLDEGKTYCKPVDPAPDVPPYCTRSLGVVDCWADLIERPDRPPEVAAGPHTLTPEQEQARTRGWLGL